MKLASLSHELDDKGRTCRVVVETPKGRRNKFNYDPHIESFTLGGLLAEGISFPFDFGFVPSTKAADGDPIDVMVIMEEPAHVGCVFEVRLIGVIEAQQTDEGKKPVVNDRLIGVAVHSYRHEHLKTIEDLNKPILEQVQEFFTSYNKSRGKKFKVVGIGGPSRAVKLLRKAIQTYEDQ